MARVGGGTGLQRFIRTFFRPSVSLLENKERNFLRTTPVANSNPKTAAARTPAIIASAKMGKKNTIPKTRIASLAGVLLGVGGLN